MATDPQFWAKIRELNGDVANAVPEKSIQAMVDAWKASAEWQAYEAGTQRDYSFYIDKLAEKWGKLAAADLRPMHVLKYRDTMRASPGSANHMVSIGKTLFKWGMPREYAQINPFREIEALKSEDDGHWPWPDWALQLVADKAWPDLARFVYLAVQAGQRESDVIRIGPGNREGRGLMVRPQKTKAKRKAFWVPLISTALITIEGWDREPLVFEAPRRKHPIVVGPGSHYILSPAGRPYTTEGLRSRWNRWLLTDDGKALLQRWAVWERSLRERDGDVVGDDDVLKPTLHGLRSTAVVIRRMAGYSIDQISNDIGMSIPMVRRYSRFMDQRAAAETNIHLLEAARRQVDV